VYEAGAFDTRQVEHAQPFTVANHPGFYTDYLPNPSTGQPPSPGVGMPAVAVQYAPNSWYVVQADTQAPNARGAVLQIANVVRLGIHQPLRFPMRLSYIPAGLHPCYTLYHGVIDLNWEEQIGLCDDQLGNPGGPFHGTALMIFMANAKNDPSPGPVSSIGGYPVLTDDFGVNIGCGDFTLHFQPSPNHKYRYGFAELKKMIEGLTVSRLSDEQHWFDGPTVLPAT
jgi:hypothetical protein